MTYNEMIERLVADKVTFHLMNQSYGTHIDLSRTVNGDTIKIVRDGSVFSDTLTDAFNQFYRLLPKELEAPRLAAPEPKLPETPYRELPSDNIPF